MKHLIFGMQMRHNYKIKEIKLPALGTTQDNLTFMDQLLQSDCYKSKEITPLYVHLMDKTTVLFTKRNGIFQYHNLNPSQKEVGDCVVRSIAIATNQSWETTYKTLCKIGLEIYAMPNDKETYTKYLSQYQYMSFKAIKGEKRMTVNAFAKTHKHGRYILGIAGHMTCVIDGIIHDIWDCGDKAIYNGWKVDD